MYFFPGFFMIKWIDLDDSVFSKNNIIEFVALKSLLHIFFGKYEQVYILKNQYEKLKYTAGCIGL